MTRIMDFCIFCDASNVFEDGKCIVCHTTHREFPAKKAVDGYLKEFDERFNSLYLKPVNDCWCTPDGNNVKPSDVKKFLKSSIERVRREGAMEERERIIKLAKEVQKRRYDLDKTFDGVDAISELILKIILSITKEVK